jgi:AcrR family transcriptional regulator
MGVQKINRRNHGAMQQRILAAASGIIERDGFSELSIRNLADVLHCSIGTIYNYFMDINELVLHINGETVLWLDATLVGSVTGKTRNTPRAIVDAYFDFLETHPNRWRALFLHYPPENMRLPDWYMKIIDDIVLHVRGALSPYLVGRTKSEGRDITVGLWAALHGLSMLDQQGKLKTVSAERSVRALAHSLVHATLANMQVKAK